MMDDIGHDIDAVDDIDIVTGTIERFGAACDRAGRLGAVLVITLPAASPPDLIDEARAMAGMYGMPLFDARIDTHENPGSTTT